MKLEDYSDDDFDRFFDETLQREREPRANPVTIGTIAMLAQQGGYRGSRATVPTSQLKEDDPKASQAFDLNAAIPVYQPSGSPARVFAGPALGRAQLFPLSAFSLMVALGGVGKTTTIISLASHIAAGKAFGQHGVTPRKVLIISVEESREELNRKFGAAVHHWSNTERQTAIDGLRMISLVGHDPRLTQIDGRRIHSTDLTGVIIDAVQRFGAELVFLDHLQGFTSGDLNNSDTATALAREANCIVSATGAAVVMAAHTNKGNIGAQQVANGFTTGSLAFENAARQVVVIIPLPDDGAKALGLVAMRRDFMLMAMPKNSYGPSDEKAYLRKVHVPNFHTVAVELFEPTGGMKITSANERLRQALVDHIRDNPGSRSKNAIEKLAGKKGTFKASKAEVRAALGRLVEEGILRVRQITKEERNTHRYPHQTKEVFENV
jgi:RecA-family ATPase